MQIHELDNYSGSLGAEAFTVVDNGTDTGKVSIQGLTQDIRNDVEQMDTDLNARIDNIIAGPASSAQEVIDIRLGADGIAYPSAGEAVRGQYEGNHNLIDVLMSENFNIDTESLLNGYDDLNETASNMSNVPFIPSQATGGMIVTALKLNVYRAGSLSVGYYETIPGNGDTIDYSKIHVISQIVTTATGTQTVQLPNPVVVPPEGSLVVGYLGDTLQFTYGSNGEDLGFFYSDYNNNHETFAYTPRGMGLNIIGYRQTSIASLLAFYENYKGVLAFVASEFDEYSYYDGYSDNNTTNAGYGTAPFILEKTSPNRSTISYIDINIWKTGTLSIGTVKASLVTQGSAFDISNCNVHEVITFTETGKQTYNLNTPMIVENDELIFVALPTDTSGFKYGPNGVDKWFYYISGGIVNSSSNSLGISFNGLIKNSSAESVYNGKTYSILGDSISTFDGYIPSGNVTYYPAGNVTSVSDTWWYKLASALGMVLDTNNSWSGSRVTTTGGAASAGCGDRCEDLGTDPDVIIVWMGINDFNNEVALGDYDGMSAVPADTTKFREAYGIMLNKILTKYQRSEVWVCTLPQCERNDSTGFPEINSNGVALAAFNKAILELAVAFGVKVLDHNKAGLTYQNMPVYNPDNLHPTAAGHSLIANNDIRQMDNFVRTRY